MEREAREDMLPRIDTGVVGTLTTDTPWRSLERDGREIAYEFSCSLGYKHLKQPLKNFLHIANSIPALEAIAITAWHKPDQFTALSIYALADFNKGRKDRPDTSFFKDRIATAYSVLDQRARAGSPRLGTNLWLQSTHGAQLSETVEVIRAELRELARDTDTDPNLIPFVIALPKT